LHFENTVSFENEVFGISFKNEVSGILKMRYLVYFENAHINNVKLVRTCLQLSGIMIKLMSMFQSTSSGGILSRGKSETIAHVS
jgi:hypothetical protein